MKTMQFVRMCIFFFLKLKKAQEKEERARNELERLSGKLAQKNDEINSLNRRIKSLEGELKQRDELLNQKDLDLQVGFNLQILTVLSIALVEWFQTIFCFKAYQGISQCAAFGEWLLENQRRTRRGQSVDKRSSKTLS